MKSPPFTRVDWFYLPCSLAGCVVYLLAALFCGTVFLAVDRHSHSVSDTFYGIYPFFVATFLLTDWIARRSSETPNQLSERVHSPSTSPTGKAGINSASGKS